MINIFIPKALKVLPQLLKSAELYEWYYGPVLCLENYKQITNILYLDAFTSALQKELPGYFSTLVVVVALDPFLARQQGQQQEVYFPRGS